MSLDEDRTGPNRSWDQFATNERLYGTRTDYHEEIYTTKLDRSGADYRAREQRAAQLEREILKVGFLQCLLCGSRANGADDCRALAARLSPATLTWRKSAAS